MDATIKEPESLLARTKLSIYQASGLFAPTSANIRITRDIWKRSKPMQGSESELALRGTSDFFIKCRVEN